MIRRHFLRISTSWTSARCRKLLRLLRPSLRMKSMHAITSAKRSKLELCLRPTCQAYCFWRVPIQLKSSRCAEDKECSAYAVLRNRVEISQAPKRKVLTSIYEDMRAVSRDTELLRFRLTMTHRGLESEFVWNRQNSRRGISC